MFRKRFSRAIAVVTAGTLVMAGVAFADNLQNDVVAGGNDTIAAGGSTIVSYRLVANSAPNGDLGGCNVDASNPAMLSISAPAGVTANPTSVQFTDCGNAGAKAVTFSSNTAGDYAITHGISGGLGGALYNNQANWTLHVTSIAPPANSAPVISSASFASATVNCRTSATLNVTFTDADAGDTHTATVDWGDGSALESLGTVTKSFSAPHTYTTPGTYTATVTVSDGTASDSETAAIAINQTYTVTFLNPVNGSTLTETVLNSFKNGRVIPVKATIADDCTLLPVNGSSTVTPTVKVIKSTVLGVPETDAVEVYADAGQSSGNTASMRWTDDGFWIYNLDSKALSLTSGQTYRVNIFVGATQATTAQWALLAPTK